jgi:hypothetical protein
MALQTLYISFVFFVNGGRIKHFMTNLENVGNTLKVKVNSNIAILVYLKLLTVVWGVVCTSSLWCFLQASLYDRGILKRYQPDWVRIYFAKEGLGTYSYEYEPIVWLDDYFIYWMTLFLRLISFIQIRSVEAVLYQIGCSLNTSFQPLSFSINEKCIEEESRVLIDMGNESNPKKTRPLPASVMKRNFLLSCLHIDDFCRHLTFISILFNSLIGLFSLVIIIVQSSFVYLIPHSNLLEIYQVLASVTCMVAALSSGNTICKILNRAKRDLHMNKEGDFNVERSKLLSDGQQILFSVLTLMVVVSLLLVRTAINDVKLSTTYDPKQTRDWLLDANLMTVKAAKMKLKLSIIRNVYLHPSTFIENA